MRKLYSKESLKQSRLKFLFLLILIFSFSAISFAQEVEPDESPDIIVLEQAIKQVVRRILIWSFKPSKKTKVIYLSQQGLNESWLPSIKNIKFKMLSVNEVKQRDADVYFFRKLEREKNKYNIGFAYGEPDCNYFGDNWTFRISNQKVKLWHNGGIGGGCGYGTTVSP